MYEHRWEASDGCGRPRLRPVEGIHCPPATAATGPGIRCSNGLLPSIIRGFGDRRHHPLSSSEFSINTAAEDGARRFRSSGPHAAAERDLAPPIRIVGIALFLEIKSARCRSAPMHRTFAVLSVRGERSTRNDDFDATVACTTVGRGVIRARHRRAEAGDLDARRG